MRKLSKETIIETLIGGVDLHTMQGYNKLGKICEKVREELGGWKRDYSDESVGLNLTFVE